MKQYPRLQINVDAELAWYKVRILVSVCHPVSALMLLNSIIPFLLSYSVFGYYFFLFFSFLGRALDKAGHLVSF